MMICLEDLRDYGYAVEYDDSIRTLFVTKDGDIAPDFNPYLKRGATGGMAGYTYETDINAYVNGSFIHTENIGGRLVAIAEELADIEAADNPNQAFGVSKYFMDYNYDDVSRTLNIYRATGVLPSSYRMMESKTLLRILQYITL